MIDLKIQETCMYLHKEAVWRDTNIKDVKYYYAESELYVLRYPVGYHYAYVFIYAKSPAEAEQYFLKKITHKTVRCEYCGKPYPRKKKAQRFCSIKCKDKWWNRERSVNSEYLHPHCEDNFNGDW